MHKQYTHNPTPRKLGNMYCFWYDKTNSPRIVVGPDYLYSLIAVMFFNLGTIFVCLIPSAFTGRVLIFVGGLAAMTLQNIAFALTVGLNPGLPPRNVSIHSKSYLNRVKTIE